MPPLAGSEDRHVFIDEVGRLCFYHHDPYAQAFSKIVRGFRRDLEDAKHFVESEMVDACRIRELVHGIPSRAYSKYPALSEGAVRSAVDDFTQQFAS